MHTQLNESLKLISGPPIYSSCKVENRLKADGYYSTIGSSQATAPNCWIEFDFQNKGVQLLSYEIQSVDRDFTNSGWQREMGST